MIIIAALFWLTLGAIGARLFFCDMERQGGLVPMDYSIIPLALIAGPVFFTVAICVAITYKLDGVDIFANFWGRK